MKILWYLIIALVFTFIYDAQAQDGNYVAEILVVIDRKAEQRFQKSGEKNLVNARKRIRKMIDPIFKKVNRMYKTLNVDGGINIRTAPKYTRFLMKDLYNRDGLGGGTMLLKFKDFMKGLRRRHPSLKFDGAILLTGFKPSKVRGQALYAKMCNKNGRVGISRLLGIDSTAPIIAHELGHLFGSGHDNGDCRKVNNKPTVMTGGARVYSHFSRCSRRRIRSFMTKLDEGNNCMSPANTNASSAAFAGFSQKGHLGKRELNSLFMPVPDEIVFSDKREVNSEPAENYTVYPGEDAIDYIVVPDNDDSDDKINDEYF